MKQEAIVWAILAVLSTGCAAPKVRAPRAASTSSRAPVEQAARLEAIEYTDGGYHAWMPLPVTSFGAAPMQTKLCVAGGYHGTPHEYSKEGQSDQLRCYDPSTRAWESLGRLPYAAQGVVLLPYAGGLVRVGGMRAMNDAEHEADLHSVADVSWFDPREQTWTDLTPLPEARSSHAACISGDELFVIGGWKLSGDARGAQWAETTWVANLRDDPISWHPIDAPFRIRAAGVACTDEAVISSGGLNPNRDVSNATYVLDLETRRWRKGPPYPGQGFGLAALGVERLVYASGSDGVVYRLDEDASQWTAASTLLFPRFFHQLVMMNGGELVAVGGIESMRTGHRVGHIERIPLDGKPHLTLLELRSVGEAKNRQGGLLQDDVLYLFGGNNSIGQHDFEPENFLAEGYALDLTRLVWKQLPDFPRRRQTMSVQPRDDGSFVAVGGFGNDGDKPETFSDSFSFDVGQSAWRPDPAVLLQGRSQFGLAKHDGVLWAFGGLNYDPDRPGAEAFDHRRDVLIAEPGKAFVDSGVRLPSSRRAFGGAVLEGRYYMVGGMKESFQLVEDCHVFDFATRTFDSMPCPNRTRLSPDLVPIGGKLFLVGGSILEEGSASPTKSIEVYDPKTRAWSTWMAEVPISGTHMRAFRFRDRLLLYSANDPNQPLVRIAFVNVQ